MPASENAMTGVAIGASLNGIRPVMTHQRVDFFLLAMDQLVNNAAKHTNEILNIVGNRPPTIYPVADPEALRAGSKGACRRAALWARRSLLQRRVSSGSNAFPDLSHQLIRNQLILATDQSQRTIVAKLKSLRASRLIDAQPFPSPLANRPYTPEQSHAPLHEGMR
jgi:hypothetical protein